MAIERQTLWLYIVIALGFALLLSACGASRRAVTAAGRRSKAFPSAGFSRSQALAGDRSRREVRQRAYIERYKMLAMREMKRYKIPASITLAQGIWESSSGLSTLARQANNHFGIKCHDWNGPIIRHDDDAEGECFRKYATAEESFLDHTRFLRKRKRYQNLFKLERDDYRGWSYGLKKAGYATDVHYPQHLIDLIERYRLDRFDQQVLQGRKFREQLPAVQLSRGAKPELLAEDRIDEVF